MPRKCPEGQAPAGPRVWRPRPAGTYGHPPGTPASRCGPKGSRRAAGEWDPPPVGQQRGVHQGRPLGRGPAAGGELPGRRAPLPGPVPGRRSVCLPSCPERVPASEVGALGLGEGAQGQAGLPGPSHCRSDAGGRSATPASCPFSDPLPTDQPPPNPDPTRGRAQQAPPLAQSLCPSVGEGPPSPRPGTSRRAPAPSSGCEGARWGQGSATQAATALHRHNLRPVLSLGPRSVVGTCPSCPRASVLAAAWPPPPPGPPRGGLRSGLPASPRRDLAQPEEVDRHVLQAAGLADEAQPGLLGAQAPLLPVQGGHVPEQVGAAPLGDDLGTEHRRLRPSGRPAAPPAPPHGLTHGGK